MHGFLMQDWTTVGGTAPAVTELTQDDEAWLALEGFADVAFLIDVSDLTIPAVSGATVSINLETAVTHDESLFMPIAPPIAFDGAQVKASSSPMRTKSVRCPSTVALARLLRWRLSLENATSGHWSITFRIRAVPGRSRFFAPTDLAGCVLWLSSDLGVTKDTSFLVSAWADQSGAGHDATSSSDARPAWTANALNGLPTLDFDGANDTLSTAAFGLGPYTVLMVATGQTGTNGFFWIRGTGGGTSDTLYASTNSTMYVNRGGTVSGKDYGVDWGRYSGAKLLTTLFDGTHAGHALRVNGEQVSTTDTFANDPGAGSVSDKLCLARRDDGYAPSATKIAEVVVYDRALAPAELVEVEEYLRHRYVLY